MVDAKNQVVTSAQVFGKGTDTKAMAPMLKQTRKNLHATDHEWELEWFKIRFFYKLVG
jgi:hypothetical protein